MKRTPLRRRTPLRAKKDLARKRWSHRPDPEKKVARFARQFGSRERLEWLKGFPCVSCGGRATDASHVRHGPTKTASEMVPQCHRCHMELHSVGIGTFQRRHGIDLAAVAASFAERWRARQ